MQELFDWEHRAFASLAGGERPPESSLVARLSTYDAAIAYTANETFIGALHGLVPAVEALSPTSFDSDVHGSLALAQPALAMGGLPGVVPPTLSARDEDRLVADEWTKELGSEGFLALHPGSGSVGKNWPGERYAELADRLADGRPVLVVEGPADEAAGAPLRARAGANHTLFARGLPLRTLGALLGQASLYVGNDSGVSHLAAAFGAPTLALFGPTDPRVWAPLGPRVRALRAPQNDLDRLDPATVAAAARDALRSWAPPTLPCG